VCYLILVITAVAYSFMVNISSYFSILICINLSPTGRIFFVPRGYTASTVNVTDNIAFS